MRRVANATKPSNQSGDKKSVGVVPLATPLLAGPGAISAVILAATTVEFIANGLKGPFSRTDLNRNQYAN
ncbi:MAG TPA: hypothetical protein ENK04_05595 [Gammaproteobacteria bacterium]|nr:hypothetical protein [Gammaproteobacteria bacterium]